MITDRTAHDGSRPAGGLPRTSRLAAQVLVQGAELVGEEVALARAELRANARPAVRGGLLLGAGAVAAGVGGLTLLATVISAISLALPVWAATLIVGGALAALGGALAAAGRKRLTRVIPGLPMTSQSIREDLRELREAARP
jgi:Putative Actinobacterial Holin-X, holin superfamily III